MSEERNVAIEESLDILDEQISMLEDRFSTASGGDSKEPEEKNPTLTRRPIGVIISELPKDIGRFQSRLVRLTNEFDRMLVKGDGGEVEPGPIGTTNFVKV